MTPCDAAEAAVEAPVSSQTDEQAAQQDNAFPDIAPEDLTALPEKAKYAVVGKLMHAAALHKNCFNPAVRAESGLALAEIGGLQMFVQEGRWYNCNRLQVQALIYLQLSPI